MRGTKLPVQTEEEVMKENGKMGKVIFSSYVALLTEKGGSEVKAVRIHTDKKKGNDLTKEIAEKYPDWNIKGVWRLYDFDFEG